jgi:hypothetical protein
MQTENQNRSQKTTNNPAGRGWMRRLVHRLLWWPRITGNPVRRYWSPWWIIGWRMIWFLPLMVAKCIFIAVASIGWGPRTGYQMWLEIK